MITDIESNKFDAKRAEEYEFKIRTLLPDYETLHNFSDKFLSNLVGKQAKILVVGAGTGEDILVCGKNNPEWSFTAVEPSSEMLAICREKISREGMSNRVTFIEGYLENLETTEKFDAATSILVSHFITSIEDKLNYFSAISNHLTEKGILITADMFGDFQSREFQEIFAGWKKYILSRGIEPSQAGKTFAYIEKDISFIAENKLKEILKESGFKEVYRFFQSMIFGGWVCHK